MKLNISGFADPKDSKYVNVKEITVTLSERNVAALFDPETKDRTLHKFMSDGTLLVVVVESDETHYSKEG